MDAAIAARIDLPRRAGAASIRAVGPDSRSDAELLAQVADGDHAAFEELYGPNGAWASLMTRADGYLGTELLRGDGGRGRYVTLDRWASGADHARFLAKSWARNLSSGFTSSRPRRCGTPRAAS